MIKNEKIKFILMVVLFGSLWGIVEATLGTILHLPTFETAQLFGKSSVIIIPIAYALMALCYKNTGKLYSVPLMGIIAGAIKLTTAFVVGMNIRVYYPAMYIVVESLAMFGALAIFRPTNVLSLKTLASIIVANTAYQLSYICLQMTAGGANPFASMEAWNDVGVKYLFTINAIAIAYSFAGGALIYGGMKLAEKMNLSAKFDFNKVLYSPVTSMVMLTLAVALTITLKIVM